MSVTSGWGSNLQTAEHVVLESDVREVPTSSSSRRTHASLRCRSAIARRSLSLSIIDYYYLAVQVSRRDSTVSTYVLDLRFVDPSGALTRHIPWRSALSAVVLTAVAVASARWYALGVVLPWQNAAPSVIAALSAAALCAWVIAALRWTETLALHSIHGRAVLLEYTSGPGTARLARPFMRKLAAHIQLAAAARRSTHAEHLRDELREHHRLKEAAVLSVEQYEASKVRILAQHTVTRRKQ